MTTHISRISSDLNIAEKQVKNTIDLLDSGATVPFISRYRKEQTGGLDEVEIGNIRDQIGQLRELDKRRDFILKTIEEQGNLTPDLKKQINAATTLTTLEDLYLPYKPKRRTRATIAKEKGLEPLANKLLEQKEFDLDSFASGFINEEKEVGSIEDALAGARDIIAEQINENVEIRDQLRTLYRKKAQMSSRVMKGKESAGEKFRDYFEWSEPLSKAPSHRILAIRRGEKEGFLMMDISPDQDEAIDLVQSKTVKGRNSSAEQVAEAAKDAYKRLLSSSIETETRLGSKEFADKKAIEVFVDNLRELLLASPLGQKTILALDPGFRSGCKLVVLDKQGKLLYNSNVYPNEPQKQIQKSGAEITSLVSKYNVEAIAIGNGTASRETESFAKSLDLEGSPVIVMVNESGASIYSASEAAREEFPDHDVTVRGAVSIGRRLADPLAELVKLDPKSIGVGQYQHDVDQNALKNSLDDVVGSCVNAVGVELNTASKQLLTYVSGLGPVLAENIIAHRNENGPFASRKDLMKVPRMGAKVFEQAAGFLRIQNGKNPLDSSAVHPERYALVKQMAKDVNCTIEELIGNKTLTAQINAKKYVSQDVGLPTLNDILQELNKPGRDPRQEFKTFQFQDGVEEIEDLKVGMRLPGIVTNVTNFGAFVDVGVHQDGLVHISQIANQFVKDPNEIVKVQQQVMVTVIEVDASRKRISLSMKDEPPVKTTSKKKKEQPKKKSEDTGSVQDKLSALKGKWG